MRNFTSEQQAAIDANGRTIVSASAGSGKTTVMIEKIVRLIQSGVDVSEILAVTYTKKAAAQMKDKLRKELIKTIGSPETDKTLKKRLKGQLPKVAGADISTVHSFCSRLIRAHFFMVKVDADFRITTGEGSDAELFDRALDLVFEDAYKDSEEQFLSLLSVYFRKKKDDTLKQIIKKLYFAVRTHADYKEMLSKERTCATDEKFQAICDGLHGFLKEKCDYLAHEIEKERAWFAENGFDPSVQNADELLNVLSQLKNANGYFTACAIVCPKFSAKQKKRKDFSDEFEFHATKLNEYKKKVQKLFDEIGDVKPEQEEKAAYFNAAKTASALAAYTLLFDEKYTELKREKNLLDYNDLEHLTLEILSDPTVLKQLHQKYRYVFVDEYQDVNPVQEKILNAVGGENLFLVGDIKQAIYGFRGSKSVYFAQKQRAFEKDEKANSLYLTKNFRSATPVLNAVNSLFSKVMTKAVSEVDYQSDSIMESGGRYAPNVGKVQVHFFTETAEKEEKRTRGIYSVEENYLKKRKETSYLAERVREIVEKERNSLWYDADDGTEKRVEYSDIAFLTRKNRGVVEKVVEAFTEAGIPVSTSSETNIFDYPEIKTLTDILKLIDNGEQDIPLCSALLSAMADCTADDLACIRLAYPQEKFYRNCCHKYANEQSDFLAYKLRVFFEYLAELKKYACVFSAGEVLTKLLGDTYMEARLLSKDNGAQCLKRIRYFIAQTSQGEPLTVHEFLDYLKAVSYRIAYGENGGENTVRVMTMHASKGLEYPVVIVGDLSKNFSGDEDKNFLFDEDLGVVTNSYDYQEMTYSKTLLWKLCKAKEQADEIKNELNLFYVALTRAKYSLHAVFGKPKGAFNPRYATSYADFVDFSVWEEYEDHAEPFDIPKAERQALAGKYDEKLTEKLTSVLQWNYPFTGGENLAVKTSATAQMNDRQQEIVEYYQPKTLFDEEEPTQGETDRERGLAYHEFLEKFPFEKFWQSENKDEFVLQAFTQMKKDGVLQKNYGDLIEQESVSAILKNDVFKEVQGYTLHREQEFLAAISAKDVYQDKNLGACADEKILFQGAIDLLALKQDAAWIIDYKYSKGDGEYLKKKYALQLALYKKAVEAVTGIKSEEIRATIVNIRLGFSVEV